MEGKKKVQIKRKRTFGVFAVKFIKASGKGKKIVRGDGGDDVCKTTYLDKF